MHDSTVYTQQVELNEYLLLLIITLVCPSPQEARSKFSTQFGNTKCGINERVWSPTLKNDNKVKAETFILGCYICA